VSAAYRAFYDAESWSLYFADGPRAHADLFGGERNVFLCGSLQDPGTLAVRLGVVRPFAPAIATGFFRRVDDVAGNPTPFMRVDRDDPARVLSGTVFFGLSEDDLGRLDAIEVAGGLRRRIDVQVRVGESVVRAVSYVKA
jgi:hypothetical protein